METHYLHTLLFTKPPSANKVINTARANRYAAASSKKFYTELACKEALNANIPKITGKPYILADISYITTTTDIDNLTSCLKFIFDGIVHAGILADDNLKHTKDILLVKATKLPKANQRVIIRMSSALKPLIRLLED